MGSALENHASADDDDANDDLGRSLSSAIKSSKSNEWRFRMLQVSVMSSISIHI